jgi:hypothetical protein
MKPILSPVIFCVLSFQLQAQVSFTLSSSPNAGSQPTWVVAADISGDGKLDLSCANAYTTTLKVLTNNGSGGFVLASSPGVGNNPNSVVAADVNGDGKVDLISANYNGNTLSVLTNNGSGGLVTAGTYSVGQYPRQVTTADVNGDGKVDLICANEGAGTLSVLTNNGSGSFVLSSAPSVGSGSGYVTAADVNGDGKVDLISANYNDNTLTVLTNNGSGGFVLSSTPNVGSGPRQIAAADANGDGKVDLICANFNDNTLSVMTNNGSGGFVLAATLIVGNGPASVVATNVSGNGKLELICANYYDNTLSILTNNGAGFGVATNLGVGSGPWSVVAADVNGDGRLDLICANTADNTLSVLLNTTPALPNITVQPLSQTVTVSSNATFSVTASGSPPLGYQWHFGQQNILGATNAFLTLTNVQASQASNYNVLVSNPFGSILSSNAVLTVTPHHFTWSPIPSPRYASSPFAVSLQARDATNGSFASFTGSVNLSSTNGVLVAPGVSGNFAQGVWTGSVVIAQTASNLVLRASDGLGHVGLANAINVISPPNLVMMRSGNIVVFTWPVSYTGFVLETSGRLSPASWSVVPYSPVPFGNLNVLPLDMTGTNGFYRLWFPGP